MCDQETLAGSGLAALSAGVPLDAAITFENSSRARSGLPESAEATARPYVARKSSGRAARTRSKDADAAAPLRAEICRCPSAKYSSTGSVEAADFGAATGVVAADGVDSPVGASSANFTPRN